MSQHLETIIIGGGQAGLAVGYLAKRGPSFVILAVIRSWGREARSTSPGLATYWGVKMGTSN